MTRLCVYVFSLFIIFALLMITALVGPSQNGASSVPAFNPPGCELPCLLNVTPGETNFDKADMLIRFALVGHPILSSVPGSIVFLTAANTSPQFVSFAMTDAGEGRYVKQIEIASDDRGAAIMTLGQMIAAGFRPVRVFRGNVNGPRWVTLLIVFGNKQPIVAMTGDRDFLSPSSPITYLIVLSPEPDSLEMLLTQIHAETEIPWFGFASVDKYLNAKPIR
jgi:hypothetical protein